MAINASTGVFAPEDILFNETVVGENPDTVEKPGFGDSSGLSSVGNDIDHYHARLRRGELLPITNWNQFQHVSTVSGSRNYGSYQDSVLVNTHNQPKAHTNNWVNAGNGTYNFKYYCTSTELSEMISSTLQDSVVTAAATKLIASKHDSLTFVAEFAKIVRMFRGMLSRFIQILRSTNPRDWASAWLEGRYGWRTLIYDIESVNDALEHLGKESPFWRAQSTIVKTYETEDITDYEWTGVSCQMRNRTHFTTEISYRGLAAGLLAPPSFGGNIIVTAWELVPFSFVIDWFLNVGAKINYLALGGLSADMNTGIGMLVVQKGTSRTYRLSTSSPRTTGYYMNSNDATAAWEATLTTRAPFTPGIIPNLEVNLDWLKVTDLIALFVQVVSRK